MTKEFLDNKSNSIIVECVCGKIYEEDDFTSHTRECNDFKIFIKDFDSCFSKFLLKLPTDLNSILIIRSVIKRYLNVIESQFEKMTNVHFKRPIPKENDKIVNIVNINHSDDQSMSGSENNIKVQSNCDICKSNDLIVICLSCNQLQCRDCFINNFTEIEDIYNAVCFHCLKKISDDVVISTIGNEKMDILQEEYMSIKYSSKGVKCANKKCKEVLFHEKQEPNYSMTNNGNVMTYQACYDYAENYLKCNTCKINFCRKCSSEPYHIGLTCEENFILLTRPKCKYDNTIITDDTKSRYKNICKNEECLKKFDSSCKRKLMCGHDCQGHSNELECLDCLDDTCEYYRDLYDQSKKSLCSICYVDELSSDACVRLDCGHLFHHHCIENLISKGFVGPEISFKFVNCVVCNVKMKASNNYDIGIILNKADKLYDKVKELAKDRLKIEGLDKDDCLFDKKSKYFEKEGEYAMDKFMFFQCNVCDKPYYAGLKSCREVIEKNFKKEELICGGCCVINGIPGVTKCKIHGKEYIDYKCKFCCSIACWQCGPTHYCNDCHSNFPTKNKKCPGEKYCPLSINHPANGNEFALGCSLCRYKN